MRNESCHACKFGTVKGEWQASFEQIGSSTRQALSAHAVRAQLSGTSHVSGFSHGVRQSGWQVVSEQQSIQDAWLH